MGYIPVQGRTYSLFAGSSTTDRYYRKISKLADYFVERYGPAEEILDITGKYRNSRRKLRKWVKNRTGHGMSEIIKKLSEELSPYTLHSREFLHSLSWFEKFRDQRLATSEEQYFCTMLEVELVNRVNKLKFDYADKKIALLPHCLRDLSRQCRSEKEGFDVVCKGCSGQCYIHELDGLFNKYQVEPYIWMEGSFRKLYLDLKRKDQVLGIFGIACLAELKAGMEKCLKYKIPALGIPLDANRCARWMGDFYPNSVNLNQVERLLKSSYSFHEDGS